MGKLICEVCGGDTLMKQEDHFRCVTCGACYSPEHLKAMQEAPEKEAPETPEEPALLKETARPKADRVTVIRIVRRILLIIALVAFVGFVIINSMINSGGLPDKEQAKSCVQSALTNYFADYRNTDPDITLGAIHFDKVEAIKFKTREEDPVGYFADREKWANKNSQTVDISETSVKWAYILTETYDSDHKVHGALPGEFRCIYVFDKGENCWYMVDCAYGTSLDWVREKVKNQVIAQVLLQYEVQHNVKVQITSIDREYDIYDYYTVYGKVTVKDKYGDEYTGKFSAKYKYDSYHHIYEQESLEVDALRKEK